jgi:EpsI family protein
MQTRVLVLFVTLMVAAGVVAQANRYEVLPPPVSLAQLPMQIDAWHGIEQPAFGKDVLDTLRADDYLNRIYVTLDRVGVGLYIGYWQSQRQGDTIHSPLNCLPGGGWEPMSHTVMMVGDPRTPGARVPINRYVIRKGIDRNLVFYWYQSHQRIVASEYWSKFYLISDAVRLNRTDGAIVRVIAPMSEESPAAEQRADRTGLSFVQALLRRLDGLLPA